MVKRFCDICGKQIDEQLEALHRTDPGSMNIRIEKRQHVWDICYGCEKELAQTIINMAAYKQRDQQKENNFVDLHMDELEADARVEGE